MAKILFFGFSIFLLVQSTLANTAYTVIPERDFSFAVYNSSDTAYLPLTAGSSYPLTGSLLGTTASFSGSVSLTGGALISSYPAVFNQTTQGTNPAYAYFQNTGGLLYSGREGSGGGMLLPSASPYASIINSTGAYPLQIGVNNSIALTLASSGAATFVSSLSLGGALISSYPAVFNQTTQGTNPAYAYFQNTGGLLYSGREGSGGGMLLPSASPYASIINSTGAYPLQIGVNNSVALTLSSSGNVGIGTTSPSEKLSVEGNMSANGFITTKKITVTQLGWSDYVFKKEYKLRSLESLEAFINQNKHLPEVPTAKEVKAKGISVGDNQALLLKKIEELTLYVIDLQKQLNTFKNKKSKK
jgi:putative hemolysin